MHRSSPSVIARSVIAMSVIGALLVAAACGPDDVPDEVISEEPDVLISEEPDELISEVPDEEDTTSPPTSSLPESPPVAAGDLTAGPCPFDVEVDLQVDCATVTVPESRSGLSGATVDLAIAILRTPNPDPAPDPVVFLAGGPGGVALAEHFVWYSGVDHWPDHPILSSRDMILVDQRGTGYSQPSLWCDEFGEEPTECHDRLVGEGVTLAAYSTPENAADIDAVRHALGIDQWNLYGSSYGTRLALVILRDHPEGVRSVLIEGVYPPDVVPAYHDYADHALAALAELVSECRDQPRCADAYGPIDELLVAALEAADTDPSSQYDSVDLFDIVFGSLYGMDGLVDVPFALALAADGEIDEAVDILQGGDAGFRSARSARGRWAADPAEDSAGLFHSIECREEHAFTDLDVVEARVDELFDDGLDERLLIALFSTVAYPYELVCPEWNSGVAEPREREPAVSDVPTLLLSGRFDPITPATWGDRAASTLSNATHVVAPSLSHSLVLEDPCIDTLVAEFLDDPTATPDISCVDLLTAPPFSTP